MSSTTEESSPPMYALGIDSSTQSCSAVIIDIKNSQVLVEESINFGVSLPQYNAPSGFINPTLGNPKEIHASPLMWLDALDLLIGKIKRPLNLSI